jgi:hypothetical protein
MSPEQVHVSAPRASGTCVQLTGFAWAGRQPLTAWAVLEEEALEAHRADHGVVGVVIAGKALP